MNQAYNSLLISIVTPVRNISRFLPETIDSVLNQTWQNWQFILVDDVSTDNTPDILKQYQAKDKRIQPVFLQENVGPGRARNEGVKVAKGSFIAFLDGDDLWTPDKLEKQITFMLNHGYEFSYTGYEQIDEFGSSLNKIIRYNHTVRSYKDILKSCSIGCSTAMVDIRRVGKIYMPDIPRKIWLSQDYVNWISIYQHIANAWYLDEVLMKYRIHANALSRNKVKQAITQWRVYRIVAKLNIFWSFYYFIHYAINGVVKNYIKVFYKK